MRKLLGLALTIVVAGALLAASAVALLPAVGRLVAAGSGVPEEVDLNALGQLKVRSQVYAADGSTIAALHGPENREPVPLATVPEPVVQAILAVEDAQFYEHHGVNVRGMARALVEDVSAGGIKQGGSTITQQLVKNTMVGDDRSLRRKLEEVPLALRLEERLSKEQILEAYLNTVYFGSGAYGVQAAAETYWGTGVDQLGVAEAAMLAALIANPVGFDPIAHPEAAVRQRAAALDRMVAVGSLDPLAADEARRAPVPAQRCDGRPASDPGPCGGGSLGPPDTYFLAMVKEQLLADPRIGATYDERYQAVFGGGLQIHTTVDPGAQVAAELAVATTVPPNDKDVVGAMVVLDTQTAAVRADVGGPGFAEHQYDLVTLEPGRQTGSTFKAAVLLAALEQGNLPFDTIAGGGSFPNPGGEPDPYVVEGPSGTLGSVTERSSNGAYVRLGQVVGGDAVVDVAQRLGLDSDFDPRAKSLPLGSFGLTPLELAGAYATIARGGQHIEPYFIERVEDREGNVLIEHDPAARSAIAEDVACRATEVLQSVVEGEAGTGRAARLSQQAAAGKTGTTEEHADAWFVGYTPYVTSTVWMGDPRSEQTSMEDLGGVANFGGTYPARIWKAFNEPWHESRPVVPFAACEPPDREARNVQGAGDGALNPANGTSSGSSGRGTERSPAPRDDEDEDHRSPSTTEAPEDPDGVPATTGRAGRGDGRGSVDEDGGRGRDDTPRRPGTSRPPIELPDDD